MLESSVHDRQLRLHTELSVVDRALGETAAQRRSRIASANIEAPDNDGVTNVLAGSTIAVLIMLALWVGGLVTYTVLKIGRASCRERV